MRSSSEWKVTTASQPPGASAALGGGEAAGELAELVVDRDAERLEAARRRVRLAGLRPRQQPLDQAGELQRRRERRAAPRSATIARAIRRDGALLAVAGRGCRRAPPRAAG